MIGIVIIAAIAALAIVLLVRAARLKPTDPIRPLPPCDARGTDAAVERFREVLRIKTVWGGEDPAADHTPFDAFVPSLRKLYPRVFTQLDLEMINGYGILLTWRGADPSAQPAVLMGHHDVVSADPQGWQHDPFAADIADGRIWARGAMDNKCNFCGLLEAAETLLAEGYVPPRTVYLWSSNCEEDNLDTTPTLVRKFQDEGIEPLFVLDEGGAVIDDAPLGVKGDFAVIGVAEKGRFDAFITTHAVGGHASTPSAGDATAKLVAGLDSLQQHPSRARLSAPLEAMLCELAAHSTFGYRIVFANLWLFRPLVLKILTGNHETAAMVRTTYGLTELEGGPAANIIPLEAKATVNVRVDPNESIEEALARIKACFDDQTDYQLRNDNEPSPTSPFDDEVFDYLRSVTKSVYPEAGVAPYIQSSSTDSRFFARVYPRVYRFAGVLYRGDQRAAIHGQNESIDVEAYKRGVGFYTEFIRHLDMLDGVR